MTIRKNLINATILYDYLLRKGELSLSTNNNALTEAVLAYSSGEIGELSTKTILHIMAEESNHVIESVHDGDEEAIVLLTNVCNGRTVTTNENIEKLSWYNKGKDTNSDNSYKLIYKFALLNLIQLVFMNTENDELARQTITYSRWEESLSKLLQDYDDSFGDKDNCLRDANIIFKRMIEEKERVQSVKSSKTFLIRNLVKKILEPSHLVVYESKAELIQPTLLFKGYMTYILSTRDDSVSEWTERTIQLEMKEISGDLKNEQIK